MSAILVPLDGSALAEHVLPYVRYLATILGAHVQLIRVVSDADKEALLAHEDVLLARLGKLSDDARARLQGLVDQDKVRALARFAAVCPTLEAFVERLNQETTPPATPTSSRRKRKS